MRFALLFLVTSLFFLSCSKELPVASSAAGKITETTGSVALDRASLIAFYHATGGEDWIAQGNWLSDGPLDEWDGVDTDSQGRVQTLWMTGNGLRGSIPLSLGNLDRLETLRLNMNQLTGSIPSSLANLSRLQTLLLSDNQLTGSIPSLLANLRNLRSLKLSNNLLTGSIPPALGNLGRLIFLELENNRLTGTIPSELGQLTDLLEVSISGNRLTGCVPSAWSDLHDHNVDFEEAGLPFCSGGGGAWPTGDFNIELVFLSKPGDPVLSQAAKAVFQRAAARWEQVILNDVPPINYTHNPKSQWSSFLQTRVEVQDVVDDLRVFVRIMDLGEDLIGSAAPTWVRVDGHFPILAEMAIAPESKDNFSLILHELGHCLGFGSAMWEDLGLHNSRDNTFSGSLTRMVFLVLAGGTYQDRYVPLVGNSHWDGGIIGDELMISGWVWPYDAPLSIVTLAAMSDMGYEVNLEAADTYFLPKLAAAKPLVEAPMRCYVQRQPIRVADQDGNVVRTIEP